ncbi:MAG TPA: sensor histidine kinase [Rhodocyclaceae bacterium]
MLPGWLLISAALAYLGLLFAVAHKAEQSAAQGRSLIANPAVYALSLAVYCTTWTYYGSVGRASVSGISFLPVYLGPTLMFILGSVVLRKILRVAKANRITSIADFIASRYGKSHLLGGLVTVIAVIGILPYIALQLKAVSGSFDVLVGGGVRGSQAATAILGDSAFYVAAAMAGFTILFGTRHLDTTERHEGMVAAIAFDSVIKLVAFLAAGMYVTYGVFNGFGDIFAQAARDERLAPLLMLPAGGSQYGNWVALTILSMLTVVLLPRQFQLMVVENVKESHLRRALWLFPAYLLVINIFVLPIAIGGRLQFAEGFDADAFVLTFPLRHGHEMLALLVFIGGLSAATGMVIAETIALSTMVCNDLVMPILLKHWARRLERMPDLTQLLLNIRRGAIGLILLLGYVYFRLAGEAYALVAIGLVSFAAVAQFAPVLLGGLFWRGGTLPGAAAGLGAGFAVWLYTLLIPSFAKSGWLPPDYMDRGIFGIDLLHPQQLFGLAGLDEITHCLLWSLLANIGAYVTVSLLRPPNRAEAQQATLFVDVDSHTVARRGDWLTAASSAVLIPIVSRFLGPARTREAFQRYAGARGCASIAELPADTGLVHFAETLLAGAIGSASARVMIGSVVEEAPISLDGVMDILDEASQVRAYSRELEEKSKALERATTELRVANTRLLELDRMKDDFISTVTHELRTPLTSIRAISELLVADPRMDFADRVRFMGIVMSETERLTRLINQMLDLAKLESGRAEWAAVPVDLNQLADESVATVMPLLSEKQIEVAVVPDPTQPVVLVDRDRLTQVMVNLLSNAGKFVEAGSGRITVRVYRNADDARVSVTDNGPGIRPEDQELIFEKFRQGGDVLTSKPSGTGLGLPISRQIIEYSGGRLWVESTPGMGACFIFSLPCHKQVQIQARGEFPND